MVTHGLQWFAVCVLPSPQSLWRALHITRELLIARPSLEQSSLLTNVNKKAALFFFLHSVLDAKMFSHLKTKCFLVLQQLSRRRRLGDLSSHHSCRWLWCLIWVPAVGISDPKCWAASVNPLIISSTVGLASAQRCGTPPMDSADYGNEPERIPELSPVILTSAKLKQCLKFSTPAVITLNGRRCHLCSYKEENVSPLITCN